MENIGNRNYATWWKPLEDGSHIDQITDKPFSKEQEQEQAALDYAEQLFASKEYTQAFPIFQHLDEEFANPAAQFKLGKFYHEGLGVPTDYREAMRYYKMAASNPLCQTTCRVTF